MNDSIVQQKLSHENIQYYHDFGFLTIPNLLDAADLDKLHRGYEPFTRG